LGVMRATASARQRIAVR